MKFGQNSSKYYFLRKIIKCFITSPKTTFHYSRSKVHTLKHILNLCYFLQKNISSIEFFKFFEQAEYVIRKWSTVVCRTDFFDPKFWFFLNIFWSTFRMIVIFLRLRRATLVEAFRYLEHLHATPENFSRATFKKFSTKNQHFLRFSSEHSESWIS